MYNRILVLNSKIIYHDAESTMLCEVCFSCCILILPIQRQTTHFVSLVMNEMFSLCDVVVKLC